jgi:hypothetical protein
MKEYKVKTIGEENWWYNDLKTEVIKKKIKNKEIAEVEANENF